MKQKNVDQIKKFFIYSFILVLIISFLISVSDAVSMQLKDVTHFDGDDSLEYVCGGKSSIYANCGLGTLIGLVARESLARTVVIYPFIAFGIFIYYNLFREKITK